MAAHFLAFIYMIVKQSMFYGKQKYIDSLLKSRILCLVTAISHSNN